MNATLQSLTFRGRTYLLPFIALLPKLSPEKRAKLKASIAAAGQVEVAIVAYVTDDGIILIDGHHRLEIAIELDLPLDCLPVDLRTDMCWERAEELALELNVHRRQMEADLEERVLQLRSEGLSLRDTAEQLRKEGHEVSHVTVSAVEKRAADAEAVKGLTGEPAPETPKPKKGRPTKAEQEARKRAQEPAAAAPPTHESSERLAEAPGPLPGPSADEWPWSEGEFAQTPDDVPGQMTLPTQPSQADAVYRDCLQCRKSFAITDPKHDFCSDRCGEAWRADRERETVDRDTERLMQQRPHQRDPEAHPADRHIERAARLTADDPLLGELELVVDRHGVRHIPTAAVPPSTLCGVGSEAMEDADTGSGPPRCEECLEIIRIALRYADFI